MKLDGDQCCRFPDNTLSRNAIGRGFETIN